MLKWLKKKFARCLHEKQAKDIGLPSLPKGHYWKIEKGPDHYTIFLRTRFGWKDLYCINHTSRTPEQVAEAIIKRGEEIAKLNFPDKFEDDPFVGEWR